jgi:arylsulfatase A-like enzyme
MIIRWPGRVAAGGESSVPVQSIDFFPTMMEMAGADSAGITGNDGDMAGVGKSESAENWNRVQDATLDGLSLVPVLMGEGSLPRDALFWHFPHYHGSGNRPSAAVRMGRWKLVEWFEDGAVELYDLEGDPGERVDLSLDRPDVLGELLARLEAWREDVGANMPRVEP